MKFTKGFNAFQKEADEKKALYESRKNKLWRFFLKDGEKDVPVRFLTEEPLCYYEHTIKDGTHYDNVTCIGDNCPYCNDSKPQWVGAWLVVDGREFETKVRKDGKETGETKIVKDRIKLLVRGSRDVSKLKAKSEKFGLTSRQWFVTRTGTGQATSWEFERADEAEKLTAKELDMLIQQLPLELRSMSFDDIVTLNVDPDAEYPTVDKEAAKANANAGVKSTRQDDDDDDEPVKVPSKFAKFKKVK